MTTAPGAARPENPRVRVVVLNYNAADLTLRALRDIAATRWPPDRLEIVLVDNASSDGAVERVAEELPTVRVVRSPVNVGFAGGVNLGLADLEEVDFVALVNNDVSVPPDWLEPLVSALNGMSDVGAACPKILLEGTYAPVHLTTAPEPLWRGDPRLRGVRLVDVVPPPTAVGSVRHSDGFFEPEHCGARTFRWTMLDATLFVPVPSDRPGSLACTIVLDSDRAKQVRVTSGEHDTVLDMRAGCHRYDIQLDGEHFDVINNVGSVLLPSAYGADRGWLEPDRGQYESGEDVFAWCGGAVLLRSEYLRDVGGFDERLFLYYEDLELSWRGRRRGWRYRYVPRSVVRHAHSATAGQDSTLARFYNERNRLLVLARHAEWRVFGPAFGRYLRSTASYARRELVAPVLRGRRPRPDILPTRLRSLFAFLVAGPGVLRDRLVTGRSARR